MDILGFIVSINKISLIAFFITLGFLVYEMYMLKKERRKQSIPQIPQFQENIPPLGGANLPLPIPVANKKPDERYKFLFIILGLLLLIFGTFTIFGFLNSPKKKDLRTLNARASESIPLASKGIRIYDNSMRLMSDKELSSLTAGQSIIIGVESIKDAKIDQARVRINKTSWNQEDIIKKFNAKYNVYYKEYIISEQDNRLNIEAQLHSKLEGWLSE